ncbi:Rad52/Rad22 family DNA repair protein [Acinetobacter sp.]|uniref:Rad52/Rad22 family DNA repair protein n=1 Tax=Acinetobacter sp. TaxID=472 RepID=UPI003D025788
MRIDLGWRSMLRKLNRVLPASLVKQRKEGGFTLDYIEWNTAADILDDVTPEWQNYIKSVQVIDNTVIVTVGIKLYNAETSEWISRENVGIEKIGSADVGDIASNAFAMAFKRAATLFGVGRHLYKAPEYAKFRQATESQLKDILSLMDSNAIPEEFHAPIKGLIESGNFEYSRAEAAINTYSKVEPADKADKPVSKKRSATKDKSEDSSKAA